MVANEQLDAFIKVLDTQNDKESEYVQWTAAK
jgi:hypothetical protein